LITDYLDEVFPEPALKPTEPAGIARMREWIKDADESGFEGVAALSFVSVFRDKILAMTEQDQESYWAKQTVLERKQRQQSCVYDGLDSPYALRAIATWERIFGKLEQSLGDGRPWIMGDQFTLADLNLAPFIARLHGLKMTEAWLADAPNTQRWWQSVQSRPSYVQARVGPSKDEVTAMAQAGNRIQPAFEAKRAAYLKEYG
jgi:glutathione S-transferase